MSKKSVIERNKKRILLVKKYKKLRIDIKTRCKDKNITLEERFELQKEISRLPRDSSPVRVRNRCSITGRPRGFYRKFGMSRIELRKNALDGKLPGVRKSSW